MEIHHKIYLTSTKPRN